MNNFNFNNDNDNDNDINYRNLPIRLCDISNIFDKAKIFDVVPSNLQIYQQAFTHKSYTCCNKNNNDKNNKITSNKNKIFINFQPKSYERLEFYGDAIISAATVEYLFFRYPHFSEGKLTKLKNKIVSSQYLSQFASFYNFEYFLLISNSIENTFGRNITKILEDTFEAFIAAISIDIDFNTAKKFVINTIDNLVNFAKLIYFNKNYKDRILNYFQINNWNFPIYQIDTQLGPQNYKTFVINLILQYKNNENKIIEKIITQGVGKTKKKAEMHASYNALKYFKLLKKHEQFIHFD